MTPITPTNPDTTPDTGKDGLTVTFPHVSNPRLTEMMRESVERITSLDDDHVNHPKHYTSNGSGIEAIQVTEWFNFCLGNAIKYIWRAGLKNANAIQDLKKSIWYLQREIERLERMGHSDGT
jgi:hypothetical protein